VNLQPGLTSLTLAAAWRAIEVPRWCFDATPEAGPYCQGAYLCLWLLGAMAMADPALR
jgi:hypothetical protein